MAKALGFSAVAVAASLAGCSPFGSNQFVCTDDAQCSNGGRCEKQNGSNEGVCVGGSSSDSGGNEDPGICYGATNGLVRPCLREAPTEMKTLSGVIDTSLIETCAPNVIGADGLCVIAGRSLIVNNTVSVMGSKPLVLVAVETIMVGAVLDASSTRSTSPPFMTEKIGPGANPSGGCNEGTASSMEHAGGAGGTFIGAGGAGGGPQGGAGGTPGAPRTIESITSLRGGCGGQDGKSGPFGASGHGGGAVYLIAGTSITIEATIDASGEGGGRGDEENNVSGGGGGGGSGGIIGLDSPMIAVDGLRDIFANGASGGEGGGISGAGAPGPEPTSVNASPQPGGNINGGDGGRGSGRVASVDESSGGPGANGRQMSGEDAAGGGGGGGQGLILVYGSVTGTGEFSPLPAIRQR